MLSDVFRILIAFALGLAQAAWIVAVTRAARRRGHQVSIIAGIVPVASAVLFPLILQIADVSLRKPKILDFLPEQVRLALIFGVIPAVVLSGAALYAWRRRFPAACIAVAGPVSLGSALFFESCTHGTWYIQNERTVLPITFGIAFVLWHFLAGVLPLIWARRWSGFGPGQCRMCGYALAGLPNQSPCPECGAARMLPDQTTTEVRKAALHDH